MHLIVGLGNPGAKYSNNRHNVGFMAVDEIARFYAASSFSSKFSGQFATCTILDNKIALLKPQTYMNLSGRAIIECSNFYKIPPSNVIVIHDELDLECGRVKVKVGGGNAGHNGLHSIDEVLENNYLRIRIGISRPIHSSEVSSYVLSDFTIPEFPYIGCALKSTAKHIGILIAGDLPKFMNNCALELKDLESK